MFRRAVGLKTKAKDADAAASDEGEERPSFSRVSFTRKSLSELADDLPPASTTPRGGGGSTTPRTPGFSRSASDRSVRRVPSGRFPVKRAASEKTKIRIEHGAEATHITLETASAPAPGGATAATAAPMCAGLARPSLSRAEALGARPGHFERTNVKRVDTIEVRGTSDRERALEARLAALEARLSSSAAPAPPTPVAAA